MSLQRKFERHRNGVILRSRTRGQPGSYIIKTKGRYELHATKGWRKIPKE